MSSDETLKRIELLMTALVRRQFASVIDEELADKRMRYLYDQTGVLSVAELTKKTGFSAGKISDTWKRWEQRGLIVKDGQRYRRVI